MELCGWVFVCVMCFVFSRTVMNFPLLPLWIANGILPTINIDLHSDSLLLRLLLCMSCRCVHVVWSYGYCSHHQSDPETLHQHLFLSQQTKNQKYLDRKCSGLTVIPCPGQKAEQCILLEICVWKMKKIYLLWKTVQFAKFHPFSWHINYQFWQYWLNKKPFVFLTTGV